MTQRAPERIEHHVCPEHVVGELRLAGGSNTFGEPNFRVVWGYDRIIPIHGEWQDFEQFVGKLTDKVTGYTETRKFTKLVKSVVETRMVPKYLPGNCWHLEMWRPPEEYGSPEDWGKQGQEIIGCMTIDTAGPYPTRGEYELCYPLTHDGTSRGTPIPLVTTVVTDLIKMIIFSRNNFNLQQRKAAIEQEQVRKDNGYVRVAQDVLNEARRPFSGEAFIVRP